MVLLVTTDVHLDYYDLMEGAQRGVRAGCSGTVDNLLIDRAVTLDCHRRKRNLSMGWVDAKRANDYVDHGWLEEMMLMHAWLCRIIRNLSSLLADVFCVSPSQFPPPQTSADPS